MGKRPKMWVALDAALEQEGAPQGLGWVVGTDGMWGLKRGRVQMTSNSQVRWARKAGGREGMGPGWMASETQTPKGPRQQPSWAGEMMDRK